MSRNKRLLMMLCILFLLLDIAIAAMLGMAIWRDRQEQTSRRDALAQQMGIRPGMSSEQQQEAMTLALGQAGRLVSMSSEVEAVQGKAGIMLSNAEENSFTVAVELVLLATGETIARTDLVDPGWRMEQLALETALSPGQYQCLARIRFFTLDASGEVGTLARQVLLTVR